MVGGVAEGMGCTGSLFIGGARRWAGSIGSAREQGA